ncbi:unnamed protein product [Urochloa decumbens]|uniref:FBD domain-containing protein n=1 Tax=Urochloa decumbens TaxID=240449 RepID=A0ABC8X4F6_9POAL
MPRTYTCSTSCRPRAPIDLAAMESTKYRKAKRANKPMPTAAGGDADLISGLNDDVLVRILQLVGDARQVVRTGTLSRRWRGLWTRVPALHFDAGPVILSPRGARRFIAFVDNALALRSRSDDSGIIEHLGISLRVCRGRGKPRLTPSSVGSAVGWIRYAGRHGVASFSLSVRVRVLVKEMLDKDQEEEYDCEAAVVDLGDLPSSTKLETMRLFLGGARVRFPSSAAFASLTDLALECFEIADHSGDGDLLGRLLSSTGCPRLQKLRLWAVRFDRARTKELVIESSTLVEVSMYGMDHMESLELRTPSLLALEILSCRELEAVTVSASGLKELTFSRNGFRAGTVRGDLSCVWHLGVNLSSHAHVSPYNDYDGGRINDGGICLLKQCRSSATCLLVDLDIVPTRSDYYVDVIKDKIPQLPNATSLAVKIHAMCERHSIGDGVAGLLTRFKNLRYLSLQLDEYPGMTRRDDIYTKDAGDLAFICSHEDHWASNELSLAKLCTAEFRGLTGTGCELRFLRFVLSSATDLEKVTIGFSINYKLGGRIDGFLHGLLRNGTWTACKDKSYEWKPCP